MKIKSILSVVLFSAILFVGCNKDDNDEPEAKVSLIGNWQVLSKLADGKNVKLEPCEGETVFGFAEGGAFTLTLKSMNEETKKCTAKDPTKGTWATAENSITLKFDKREQTASYKLTSTSFILTYTDKDEGTTEVLSFKRVE